MKKPKIIIIGGGAAGLMAAKELVASHSVLLIESDLRLGGRMHTFKSEYSSRPIEAGAEFIHGDLPITKQLLKEAGIDYTAVKGEMYRKKNGKWSEEEEMIEGWDEILKKMKAMPDDMTLYDFLEQYYKDKKFDNTRKHISNFAEGFDVADIKKVSVKALYKEWSHEEPNYRIPKGYGALVNYLQSACEKQGAEILAGYTVKRIYWEKGLVTVYTHDGERYDAEKAIITVPLTVLRSVSEKEETSIRFIPALDNYKRAAANIGIGAVLKIILQFEKAFWKSDTGFILSDEIFPTWWTQSPDPYPMLTGWIGGPRVENFKNDTEEQILEKALQSLANIYEISLEEIKKNTRASSIFNWQDGAYSYPTPKTPEARKLLNKPVENTLFFAGEGIYEGESQGTVEAGLASGKEAAKKCLAHG